MNAIVPDILLNAPTLVFDASLRVVLWISYRWSLSVKIEKNAHLASKMGVELIKKIGSWVKELVAVY